MTTKAPITQLSGISRARALLAYRMFAEGVEDDIRRGRYAKDEVRPSEIILALLDEIERLEARLLTAQQLGSSTEVEVGPVLSAASYWCPKCGESRLLVEPCAHVAIGSLELAKLRDLVAVL